MNGNLFKFCVVLNENHEVQCLLYSPEGQTARTWSSHMENAECAYGGYFNDTSGSLETDLADLDNKDAGESSWWDSRTEESIRAWHQGVNHWLAWICGAQVATWESVGDCDEIIAARWI